MLPLRDELPTRRFPVVNYALIAANVVAYIWELAQIGHGYPALRFLRDFGLVPRLVVTEPGQQVLNVFSSMFLHDPNGWTGLQHIGVNMLFLWIFGDNVEDALGRWKYLFFYLASGIAAGAAQVLIDPHSMVPMVGASGAIAGVLAAYGSLYPRSPITVMNPIVPLWLFMGLFWRLPAWVVILEFFLYNLLNGLGSLGTQHGGIAFFAHLGGFVAGLILVRVLVPPAPRPPRRWDEPRPQRHYDARARPGLRPDAPGPRGPWDW